ncbi:MAG TPA: TIGR04283 family arsenosugar biosynthesis glycosyltransferase [Chthoniobacterales bacterium]
MQLSVIIPVLNEQGLIADFLVDLRRLLPAAELIVVDGGSDDATCGLAAPLADKIARAPAGRGRQMNAGAAVAQGEVLWFLHADSRIPANAAESIAEALTDPSVAGGCFSLMIVPARWILQLRDAVGNLCVDLFGIALGDRGLFCRRSAFIAAGGYTTDPLFEDANLYRELRRIGSMRRVTATIKTSARRYEALGPFRTSIFYGLIMLLYWAGLDPKTLETFVFHYASSRRPARLGGRIRPLDRFTTTT